MNPEIKVAFITAQTSIEKTIEIIDSSRFQIALVVDEDRKLKGVVTDGDIRRATLQGLPKSSPSSMIMNKNPTTFGPTSDREEIRRGLQQKIVFQIPVVDAHGRVIDIEVTENIIAPKEKTNNVILMAGGLGKRLAPLTDSVPKPLISIGGQPILKTIVEKLQTCGFRKINLSVNYRAEMVKQYFGDGSQLGVQISYIEEREFLGTAGCLGLIDKPYQEPFLVMNGDVLTKINFDQLLQFHQDVNADITMGLREYSFQVPYGVVRLKDDEIINIEEKPTESFFVNAGIYVLSPTVFEFVNRGEYLDMPDLVTTLIQAGKTIRGFPIREYWLDIGRKDDLERAGDEFASNFAENVRPI